MKRLAHRLSLLSLNLRRRVAALGGALGVVTLVGLPLMAGAQHGGVDGKPVVKAAPPSYTAAANVSGSLTIAGSDTMQPLLARMASEFQRRYMDTKIAVQGGGTDSALEAFVQGNAGSRRGDGNVRGHLASNEVMLLASSRALTPREIEEFRARYGYEPTEVPIAMDAVAIYVNRENPIEGLTLEQADAIFGQGRKRGLREDISTWGQVGLKDGWEQEPIALYGRDRRSGTRTFFKHVALLDGELKTEVREAPGSASEILAIARDPLGIGYAGIEFQASMVRAVPLAEKAGMPYVKPSPDSASNGTYPLSRHLYLYVNKAPDAELKPAILEFLKFVNSREGQETVVKAGAYPLSLAVIARNLQGLTGSAGPGSAFTAATN